MTETSKPVQIDLGRPRRIHSSGVGGSGMSAIAGVLAAMGHVVSGTDLKESVSLERLRAQGVTVWVGHDRRSGGGGRDRGHVDRHPADATPRWWRPGSSGCRCCAGPRSWPPSRAPAACLAVAGTHGKTTTSSMLALVLVEAGLQPSFIIGGEVNEIGTGAAWDTGDWFVVEADESDGTFLELGAEAALVTNVEPDHLEHYGDFDGLVRGVRPVRDRGTRTRRAGGGRRRTIRSPPSWPPSTARSPTARRRAPT